MEMNGMYLSKGNEWKIMELITLIGYFKINEWNVSNLIWERHGGKGTESFYNNIIIRLLF